MKKKLIAFLIAILTVFCCIGSTGCFLLPSVPNIDTKNYEANVSLDKNVEATISVLVPNYDGGLEKNIIEAVANEFKNVYPNVTIVCQEESVADKDYRKTIPDLVNAGELPDLVYTNTALYYYLVGNELIWSLEPYFKAAIDADQIDLNKYYAEYFEMGSWDGLRYVIPRNMDSVVTYYNKSMMAEAGIDLSQYEENPDTWTMDAFLSVCEKLTAFWEQRGYGNQRICMEKEMLEWESVWNPIMQSYGSNAYTDKEVTIDSEGTKKYAELYREMANKGYIPDWTVTSGCKFDKGDVAFQFASNGPQYYQDRPLIANNFDFLPFPLVNGENSKIGTGFAGWGISSRTNGTERDVAWAFLQFLISEQGQRAMYSSGKSTTPSVVKIMTLTKEWAKDFKHLNLNAFTAHTNKKITSDYYKDFDPKYMYDIQTALQHLAQNSMTRSLSIDEVISRAEGELAAAVIER